jgi:sialidase-1
MTLDDALIEPVCQASILRLSWPDADDAAAKSRIVFCNPASTKREKLTLRISHDEGRTWAASRLLYSGSAAYSCLTRLKDGSVGVLFERDGYSKITFVPVTAEWIEK